MGQLELSRNYKITNITKNHFDFKYVIGRGGFGKVWKVTYKKSNIYYALKEMSKVKIIDKRSENNVMSERHLLAQLHNPFICNMIYSFQDFDFLYLVLDYLPGGDLRYHICNQKRFDQEETKFFIACTLLALEYIHSSQIIHRDIKPENLVLDKRGYLHLTDFGVAKKVHKNNGDETSGTPGYMAPEVLCSKNHSYPVDFYALGVMGYEFMIGKRPYLGKNRKEIKHAVLARQVRIKEVEVPMGWSFNAANLINSLIERRPAERLGTNGIAEIMKHPFFDYFDWKALRERKMVSPFKVEVGDNFDKSYCKHDEVVTSETIERYHIYRENERYADLFKNYTCNNITKEEINKFINEQVNKTRPTFSSISNVSNIPTLDVNSEESNSKNMQPELKKIKVQEILKKSASQLNIKELKEQNKNKNNYSKININNNNELSLLNKTNNRFISKDITKDIIIVDNCNAKNKRNNKFISIDERDQNQSKLDFYKKIKYKSISPDNTSKSKISSSLRVLKMKDIRDEKINVNVNMNKTRQVFGIAPRSTRNAFDNLKGNTALVEKIKRFEQLKIKLNTKNRLPNINFSVKKNKNIRDSNSLDKNKNTLKEISFHFNSANQNLSIDKTKLLNDTNNHTRYISPNANNNSNNINFSSNNYNLNLGNKIDPKKIILKISKNMNKQIINPKNLQRSSSMFFMRKSNN